MQPSENEKLQIKSMQSKYTNNKCILVRALVLHDCGEGVGVTRLVLSCGGGGACGGLASWLPRRWVAVAPPAAALQAVAAAGQALRAGGDACG